MLENFKFILQTQTYVGIGYHEKIADLLCSKGYKRITIIVDEAVANTAPFKVVYSQIKQLNILAACIQARGNEEPDYAYLDKVAAQAALCKPDCLLAIGGGSTIDLAKGTAVLLTNGGQGIDYRGFDKVSNPGVPVMAVPTTAGTGSEITVNAVFSDKVTKKKLGINGHYLNAQYAVLDPIFTVSAPRHVAVSSGMDALVHTLESFVGSNANAMTRFFAKEAFNLLYHNLPAIIDEPDNLTKRLNIQLGAYYAAISLFNSSSGIAGAISYPLGVHYHVPHGIGGGMFAVPVVQYNVDHGYYDYAMLYDMIEKNSVSLTKQEKSNQLVHRLQQLVSHLAVPTSLSVFGIVDTDYQQVVEIMQPLQAAFDQNPIKLDVKDVGVLLAPFFAKIKPFIVTT